MRLERLGLLAGLFLAALALRPQLVGVGPLIPEIQDDLDLSHAVAGLLGTIPVLCMGLFAPPAPHVSRRLGSRYAIAACLAGIAVFGIARALVPGAAGLILLTFGVGVGIGVAQALMPVAVKERFAHRPAFATGIYAAGINVGSALSSALAVPIADAAGGWRWSLGVFSLVTAGLLAAWLLLMRREPPHRRSEEAVPRLPLRNGLAWLLVAVFGVMGTWFYGVNAWLPDAYVERGWSEESAGALLAVLNSAALATTVLVPWLADRHGSRRLYLAGLGSLLAAATLGLVLWPDRAWAWAALAGLAIGGLFPLVMTLPLDVADRPADVGAVAGMMLGIGYVLAAVAPLGLGAVRDATGSFDATMWLIFAASAVLLALCSVLSRERLHAGAMAAETR